MSPFCRCCCSAAFSAICSRVMCAAARSMQRLSACDGPCMLFGMSFNIPLATCIPKTVNQSLSTTEFHMLCNAPGGICNASLTSTWPISTQFTACLLQATFAEAHESNPRMKSQRDHAHLICLQQSLHAHFYHLSCQPGILCYID